MRRKWRVRGALLVAALALVATAGVARADVTVRAVLDRPRVQVGEAADLGVELQGAQSSGVPSIANAGGAAVRYLGPSSRVSFVNGAMSSSVTHHFQVSAPQVGRVTIGPITVEVGGKTYDAGSVTLDVVAATGDAAGGGGPAGNQLRLELSAPRTTVYLQERVSVRLKLMVGSVRVNDVQYPTLAGDGFAIEKFPEPDQRQEQTADGTFQVLDFATIVTPLRSGALTLGPASIGLSVLSRGRGRGSGFDRFFTDPFFGGEQRHVDLDSQPLALTVLPLPENGKPADFSGAVGTFDFDAKVAPLAVTAGDPVTVTMTIRGTGSLENVTPPPIAGDGLRVYPAQTTTTPAGKSAAGANVQMKTFEQVVIPERPGNVALPALRFSFFDAAAGTYKTITHPATPVAVAARPAGEAPPRIVGAAPAAPAPQPETLGHDLVFIKDAPGRLRARGARLHRSPVFWAAQLIPLLAWAGVVVVDRRRQRLHGDAGYARFTRAGREARLALAEAKDALQPGNQAVFYDTLARALTGYLSAKLQLPPGAVTADAVAAHIARRGVSGSVADQLRDLFEHCEQVRFAPSTASDGDMQRRLDQADAVIRTLERERRLGPPLAAALLFAALVVAGVAGSHAAGGGAADESPQGLFFRGNALYGDERYADAIALYEKVLATGHESGNLYFNLGNAYFKTGDVGRAVLQYERALRLIPRDPDLHANLGYARESSGDTDATPLWARIVLPLASRASSDELLMIGGACLWLLCAALIVGRLVPRAARAGRVTVVGVAVLLTWIGASATYRLATVDLPTYAVVVAADDTDVRFEPSPSGTTHFDTKPGAVLRVLGEREGWAQVARADGKRGWIARDAIASL